MAHPPGYPLSTLLAGVFCALPIARHLAVGLFSACCDAAAAALLFILARRVGRSGWLAGWAAAAFAFSPVVWTWAIAPEVFALHHLLLVGWLFVLHKALGSGRLRDVALAGLVAGLGLAHHQTMIFVVVPAVPLLWWAAPTTAGRLRALGAALVGAAAGLSPYLLLLVFGHNATTLSLGAPLSFQGLLRHVLRSDYGTFQLVGDGALADAPAGEPDRKAIAAAVARWSAEMTRTH